MKDWAQRLKACGDAHLAAALMESLTALLDRDAHLLAVDAHEIAIAARLMAYLHPVVGAAPDGRPWDVDVDYNRQQARVKTILGSQIVRPDVVVHRRDTDAMNLLAIEIKKGASPLADPEDTRNLAAYKLPLEEGGLAYTHALFLRLGVLADAGKVTCVRWL